MLGRDDVEIQQAAFRVLEPRRTDGFGFGHVKAAALVMRESGSGGRIRTCDLRVMSPTSYLAALPRVGEHYYSHFSFFCQKQFLTVDAVS